MRRTKIIIYPGPPWTEELVSRDVKLQKTRAVSCEQEVSIDPPGWKVTVVREYPDA